MGAAVAVPASPFASAGHGFPSQNLLARFGEILDQFAFQNLVDLFGKNIEHRFRQPAAHRGERIESNNIFRPALADRNDLWSVQADDAAFGFFGRLLWTHNCATRGAIEKVAKERRWRDVSQQQSAAQT